MNEAAMATGEADVAKILETAAERIEYLDRRLELADAQLRVVGFVETLVGMRGGPVNMIGEAPREPLSEQLRYRAKAMRRVTGRSS